MMQQHPFGRLPTVSTLTLGGGGLGMLWGQTSFDECVATVHAAVAAGITLLDLAPRYGDGKAEQVVGEAFAGRLPAGVRITSKCNLGNPPPAQIEAILRQSIEASLRRLRLSRLDIFFLHSNIVPDEGFLAARPDAASRMTPYALFADHARPVFERLVAEGLIGAWGLTGIGHPDTIIRLPRFPELDSKVEILSVEVQAGGQVASAMVACRWSGVMILTPSRSFSFSSSSRKSA
jgi:aryl-alcohol dehydrogenase-like predicted oxidoreductase